MDVLLALLVLAAVIVVVLAPLRRGAAESAEQSAQSRRAELEALKLAKLREIRDAELDYRTGKLSQADWRTLDRALRREAIDLLRQMDDLPGGAP